MTRIVGLHRHKRRWCSRCPELPPPAPKPPGWSHLQTSWESEQDLWSSHGMIRGFWFFSMLDFLAPCLRECVLFSFTALLNSTWGRSFQTVNRVFSISSWRVRWLLDVGSRHAAGGQISKSVQLWEPAFHGITSGWVRQAGGGEFQGLFVCLGWTMDKPLQLCLWNRRLSTW